MDALTTTHETEGSDQGNQFFNDDDVEFDVEDYDPDQMEAEERRERLIYQTIPLVIVIVAVFIVIVFALTGAQP